MTVIVSWLATTRTPGDKYLGGAVISGDVSRAAGRLYVELNIMPIM